MTEVFVIVGIFLAQIFGLQAILGNPTGTCGSPRSGGGGERERGSYGGAEGAGSGHMGLGCAHVSGGSSEVRPRGALWVGQCVACLETGDLDESSLGERWGQIVHGAGRRSETRGTHDSWEFCCKGRREVGG